MGRYGASIAMISGQGNGAEIVVAASLFLQMQAPSTYITPISKNHNVRDEFLLALSIFSYREYSHYSSPKDKWCIDKFIEPNENATKSGLFWLALDEQGYSIAKELFLKNGLLPDELIYRSVRKLNLLEKVVPPYPLTDTSSEFWLQIRAELYRVAWERRRVKSLKGRRKLFDNSVQMSSTEKEFHSWFKSLYESLAPWKEIIGNMNYDWS